jgi:hypothetical protein
MSNTTTTELLPLFQEWAEMESDRCIVKRYGDPEANCLNIEVKFVCWVRVVTCTRGDLSFSKTDQAIVQAVVQEAISDHGWFGSSNTGKGSTVENPTAFVSRGVGISSDYSEGLTPAIALLAAYVQAIRAARAAS